MTDDDAGAPKNDYKNDYTYADALKAAQPRLAELAAQATALADQVFSAWRKIEPGLRAWIAEADTLTEQQWMDEPVSTREFYDHWKRWFAEHNAPPEGEGIQP